MGMFDSLFNEQGHEYQTKAFDCELDEYQIGDPIVCDGPASFQVEVLGGPEYNSIIDAFATVTGGTLSAVGVDRDKRYPLLNYSGHLIEPGVGRPPG